MTLTCNKNAMEGEEMNQYRSAVQNYAIVLESFIYLGFQMLY